jgi:hypothetical protein
VGLVTKKGIPFVIDTVKQIATAITIGLIKAEIGGL